MIPSDLKTIIHGKLPTSEVQLVAWDFDGKQ